MPKTIETTVYSFDELNRADNYAYTNNLRVTMKRAGVRFSDGKPL